MPTTLPASVCLLTAHSAWHIASIFAMAVPVAAVLMVVTWMGWTHVTQAHRLRRCQHPDNCGHCGRTLTPEEKHYYGHHCEKCEGALLQMFDSTPMPPYPVGDHHPQPHPTHH